MEINKVIEIIEEYIIEDEKVIAETEEYKFARTLCNFKLNEIIKRIKTIEEGLKL